jgi:hypothetical protein
MNAQGAHALRSTVSPGGQPRFALPPWQLLLRAPVFAAVGAYVGTFLTVRAWADCPLGNDAGDGFALTVATTSVVWAAMTAALLVSQLSLWALAVPVPGLRCLQWLVPVATVVALTVAYRAGMQSPTIHPDGSCYEGYPPFPFEPKRVPFGPPGG